VLTDVDGKLYGRGSSDDKGPVLGWLWAIEASRELGYELPVNITMVFEGGCQKASTEQAPLGPWSDAAIPSAQAWKRAAPRVWIT
jgi:acetylornithine deacetylase/succinyl-diaminopimelate desuccinylase-like protein